MTFLAPGKRFRRRAEVMLLFVLSLSLLLAGCASKSSHSPRVEDPPGVSSHTPVSLMITSEMSSEVFGKPINGPSSIRLGPDGSVYVIDHGNQRVLKLDQGLVPLAERGGLGSFKGMFKDPRALALTPNGRVYVADAELLSIQRFDADLNVGDQIIYVDNEDGLKYGRPSGLAVSVDNDLWVVDRDRARIAVFDRFHKFQEFVADYNSGGVRLERPGAAITLPDNRIAVCDTEAGRVVVYGEFGTERLSFGDGFLREPTDIAYDPLQRFWVIDSKLEEVLCFSSSGELLFRSGQLTESSHFRLTRPSGICALDAETLLISDSGANRIIRIKVFAL